MSLTKTDEGNLETPAGGAEQPTSQTSGEQGQPLPDSLRLVLDRLDEQGALIKGLQKGTDKQISQVRNDVKRILELKESGMTEAQIQRELQLDELLGNRTAVPAEPVGKQASSEPDFDVESIFKAMQFEENDVYLAALKVVYGNKADLLKAAAKLRLDQLAVKPVSPANALPPQGGQAPGTPGAAELVNNYKKDMIAARGKPSELNAIKNKYTSLGVNIHEVVFS